MDKSRKHVIRHVKTGKSEKRGQKQPIFEDPIFHIFPPSTFENRFTEMIHTIFNPEEYPDQIE